MTQLAVIGAGITGLAAAHEAALAGADVTVIDPASPGGKLRTSTFAGLPVDEAADAFLARVPEGVALCAELGIDGDLVSPAARRAYVWSRGALRMLPEENVLGVPTDLDALAASGIVSAEAVARARKDLVEPGSAPVDDEAIGSFIRRRLGDEILERLVDPLVGGINAGDTDDLSLAAVVPQLDAAARAGDPSLIRACAAQRRTADTRAPVFFAPRGGMGAIADALVDSLGSLGARFVSSSVASIDEGGRTVMLDGGERLHPDAALLTTSSPAAASIVRPVSERAATLLGAIPYASVVLVALAVRRDTVDHALDGSGYLVPRSEGTLLTACSWTSSKWTHLDPGDGTVLLRASCGRHGDDRALDLDDAALVAAVRADLEETMGLHGEPLDVRVSRWPSSFPQYRPGHEALLRELERELASAAPNLLVTGAAFRGLGVPACIRQGRGAARTLLDALDRA